MVVADDRCVLFLAVVLVVAVFVAVALERWVALHDGAAVVLMSVAVVAMVLVVVVVVCGVVLVRAVMLGCWFCDAQPNWQLELHSLLVRSVHSEVAFVGFPAASESVDLSRSLRSESQGGVC